MSERFYLELNDKKEVIGTAYGKGPSMLPPDGAVLVSKAVYNKVKENNGKKVHMYKNNTLTDKAAPAMNYKDKRRFEYPPITDQLDEIWKAIESLDSALGVVPSDTTDMLSKINTVKGKNPKPSNGGEIP